MYDCCCMSFDVHFVCGINKFPDFMHIVVNSLSQLLKRNKKKGTKKKRKNKLRLKFADFVESM